MITEHAISQNYKQCSKTLRMLLKDQNPILVYEFVRDIILSNCICIPSTKGNSEPLPLKCKLRIAMGIANAVAYISLYCIFRPVIHTYIFSWVTLYWIRTMLPS